LYAADRAQHLKEKIIPEPSSGKTVVCDRFFDATTIYQGFARGLDMELIQNLHHIVLDNLKPDLTILFDLPVKTGLSRAWEQIGEGSRSNVETRFEKETLAFHEKVRSGYLELARQEPDRIQIIDASHDEQKVYEDITVILSHKLENKYSVVL
jgi:dTMP kinase